jgi:hypothetical protein
MLGNSSPVRPTFAFRAERASVEVRLRHFLVQGDMVAGMVKSGARVWLHAPGGATEVDVVEITADVNPVAEARAGQRVGLLLRGGRILTRVTAGTGVSDSPNYIDQPPEHVELGWKDYSGPEALEWLRTAPNGDDNAFASNRFQGTENAIRFVETLYEAGAAQVIINQENIVDEGGGDLYADALVVLFPQDPAARARVIAICKREADREDGSPSSDADWESSECTFLWWD